MGIKEELLKKGLKKGREFVAKQISPEVLNFCLLYTSDAADE